jgi:hypothetical protein
LHYFQSDAFVKSMIKIPDQLASPKLRWMRKRIAAGICPKCANPIQPGASQCSVHLAKDAERMRRKGGFRPWKAGGRGRPAAGAALDVESY